MKFKYIGLFIIIFLIQSCGCKETKVSNVFFLVDITDEANYNYFLSTYKKSLEELSDLMEEGETCHELYVSLSPINDQNRNVPVEVNLKAAGPDENPYKVQDNLTAFLEEVNKTFDEFVSKYPNWNPNLKSTRLYAPLCELLNEIEEDFNGEKVVVIFSDMLENSEHLRIHNLPADFNTQKELERLMKDYNCDFPDLGDIEIHVVNISTNATNANQEKSDRFWKDIFTDLYEAKKYKVRGSLKL